MANIEVTADASACIDGSRLKKAPQLKVSWREKLSYGIGDLACSMIFNFMASYLFYFYTDVAGIAVGITGTIISTARLVDAFINPVVGIISDRTRTRWGKLRPYVLFATVPLAASTVLVFLVPQIPENYKFIYALVTYMAFCILYTICNVPYTALMSSITEDKQDRSHLNMTKFISASTGSLISMGLAMQLVAWLGKGNEQKGFLYLSVSFAVVVVVLLLTSFFGTQERIITVPQKFSFKEFLTTAKKSRPWLVLCLGQMCMYFASNSKNSTTLYYAKYVLGASDFASILLALGALTTIPLAFIMPKLVAKMKKRVVTQIGQLLFVISCILTFFAGDSLVLIFLCTLIGAFGNSLVSGVSFLILGETIDHSEYVTGNRQQGLFTSMFMFMTKMGIVISGSVTAFVLSMGGYEADVLQTAESLSAIRFNFVFIPAITAALAFFVFCFYNLDKYYDKINAELQQKR